MDSMNVKRIVEEWLREHGYDGLCADHCGCFLIDLMPCDSETMMNCCPGYAQQAGPNQNDYDEGDWIVGPEKPEARNG